VRRLFRGLMAASLLLFSLVPAASAHTGIEVGDYILTIGWRDEPAYAGQPNGVQLFLTNHDDESPVNDLGPDDLSVVVSTAGQDSPSLSLTPQFSVEEDFGTPGEYGADLFPTAPGDYTFHLTGTIGSTPVDVEVTSGEDTFSPILASSDAEFPVKLPNLGEVATRLDRIDARIAAIQSTAPGGGGDGEALAVAQQAADAARAATSSASQALLLGMLVGGAGLVVAVIALALALRAGRRSAGSS
jgi:hypothetical protein